jgi:hypothetical protein
MTVSGLSTGLPCPLTRVIAAAAGIRRLFNRVRLPWGDVHQAVSARWRGTVTVLA